MRKRIAVLGANEPLLQFYRKVDRSRFEVHGIAWADGSVCRDYCDVFHPLDLRDRAGVLSLCESLGIEGASTFSLESAVPLQVFLAEELGLVHPGSSVKAWVGNKAMLRDMLRREDVGYNPASQSASLFSALDLAEMQFPVVVKPMDGGGSRGVVLAKGESELPDAFAYAQSHSKCGEVVVEEFLLGEEFSVEYISYGGRHYFLALTRKRTSGAPHFVELHHTQPSGVDDACQLAVRAVVERALDVLGIENGVSHTEIIIGSDGRVSVVEVGPRMGGDYITSHLTELSTGVDLVNLSLSLACGDFAPPVVEQQPGGGVLFYTPDTRQEFEAMLHGANVIESACASLAGTCENNMERSGYLVYRNVLGNG
ncbi:MAG: hypothetical protein CSA97_01265 [Bacteroidetes bacterium]|nr:MAG: hypothetical protein CSA97_01265 [Bacteroidota bacterium]